jgi:hypothetical protein
MSDCGDFTLGPGNTIGGTGNENEWALSIDAGSFPSPGSVIPTSGNTNIGIRVVSGSSTHTGAWHSFPGIDYFITDSPSISAIGSLTIEAGNTLNFNDGKSLYIYGTLNATGTISDSILFTRNGVGQEWYGILFQPGSSGDLDYCIIEHASDYPQGRAVYANAPDTLSVEHCVLRNNAGYNGSGFWGTNVTPTLRDNIFQDNGVGIYIQNSNAPMIGTGNVISDNNQYGVYFQNVDAPQIASGTVISGNSSCGIYYRDCSSLGTVDGLVLTGNGGYGALYIANSGDFTLGAGNTIGGTGNENEWALVIEAGSFPGPTSVIPTTGNTNNDLRVTSGTSTNTGTWPYFSTHNYHITESPAIGGYGSLTIEAGTTLEFDHGTNLFVNGILNAMGTFTDSILFTRSDVGQEWTGLHFYSYSQGDLDYFIIEHASSYPQGKGILPPPRIH